MMSKAWSPLHFYRTEGRAPVVLVCEHAAPHMPEDFGDLGLDAKTHMSHAVWDIGALKMAEAMSQELDAPLVSCGVSRAIYDCNRPFAAPDCIPSKSENIAFPGNVSLSASQRDTRRRLIHDLFHEGVAQLIASQSEKLGAAVAVITLHSFTPVYFGTPRTVEIGFLHHDRPALSEAAFRVEQHRNIYNAALNEPYAKQDGVTYSLARHADAQGLHSTMIEVRNDLIQSDSNAQAMGQHLAATLKEALARVTAGRGA